MIIRVNTGVEGVGGAGVLRVVGEGEREGGEGRGRSLVFNRGN